MTIDGAIKVMTAYKRMVPKGASVLNPEISAMDAWELVWRDLLKVRDMRGANGKYDTLADWFARRIQQVCFNRMNPDLGDGLPHLVLPPPASSGATGPVGPTGAVGPPNYNSWGPTGYLPTTGPMWTGAGGGWIDGYPPPETPKEPEPEPPEEKPPPPKPFARKFL